MYESLERAEKQIEAGEGTDAGERLEVLRAKYGFVIFDRSRDSNTIGRK